MYTVYVLFSQKLNKYYVGSCVDFQRRLYQHNTGQSRFTRTGLPWSVIIKIHLPTRIEALALERKIKKRGIRRFLVENGISE
jgi:putative endonuclease